MPRNESSLSSAICIPVKSAELIIRKEKKNGQIKITEPQ